MPRASSTGVRGLYKGADGTYRIDLRWEDASGVKKRYREKFPRGTNGPTAKRRALDLLNAALSGELDPDRPPAETLRAALDRYLDHCEAHGLRSVASRRTHAKALVAFLGEKREVGAIDTFAIERFKADLRAKGKEPATVNRHLQTLKHFAKWARTHAGMPGEVARAIREDVGQLAEPEGRKRYLTADEEQTILGKLDGWLRPIALACKLTGGRLGELTSLRWRDVDRTHGIVRFTRTKTNRTREVALVPALAEVLDGLVHGEPGDFVFPVPRRAARGASAPKRTEEARRRDVASRAWGAFCVAQGIEDLHAHDLRHHAATMIRRAGGGLDTVAKVLGHTNVRTAARYAHVEVEDTRRFLEAASVAQPLPTKPGAADAETA